MFKLKKLQILGFKSFCDRTELHFNGTGVVGIVGPNGCGKSNIGDAISWVLGEQSAKSLRGGRMEDVIFAGTRERPATGMAEVSLTLADPQECDLELVPRPMELVAEGAGSESAAIEEIPVEAGDDWDAPAAAPEAEAQEGSGVVLTIRKRRKFVAHNRRGEVVVTRRLFRDGASEYLMNGRPCRLRDIQDLFMGTGLGPESYAIIEQGRIGQILSSKPYDRRAVIEEAAGVSKYKAKRRLAEARLEAARQNLSRINDIFEEVTRQVGSLKRQAAKAQRYQGLKAEYDQKQRWVLAGRGAALAASQAGLQQALSETAAAVTAAQAEANAQEAARAQAAARCRQLEDELRHGTEACGSLERQCDQARQQIAFGEQQQQELEQRVAILGAERQQLESRQNEAAGEREQAVAQADAAGEGAAAARADFAARREEHAAAAAAVVALEAGIERDRQASMQLLRQAAALGSQIAQFETQAQTLQADLERWGQEESRAGAELEAGGERRGQLQLEFLGQQSEAEDMAARQRELESRVAELRDQQTQATQAERQSRTRLAEVSARRRSLEEIVARHGYSSEVVRQLLTSPPAAESDTAAVRFAPQGVLGEFLEAEPGCEAVLEQFLHDELNYVVVGDWDEAGAGMGLVRRRQQGRATFLVHDAAAAATEPPREIPGVRPLLSQVRALNGFRHGLGAVLPKLNQAYLAPDAARARQLAGENPTLFFLTPAGECYHHHTVSGGAGSGTGPLSLKRELRELQRDEAALQAETQACEQRLARLGTELADHQRRLETVRGGRHELEKRLLTSGQAVRTVEAELTRAQARQQQARLETERARARRQQIEDALGTARQELARADDAGQELRQRELAAAATAEAARERRAHAAGAMAASQAEAARVEERASAAVAALERLQRQLQELERQLQRAAEETDALGRRRRQLAAANQELAGSADALEQAIAARRQQLGACEAALGEARAAAAAAETGCAAAREKLDQRRHAAGETEIALARLDADFAHLRQSCRDELQCELETLSLPEEPVAPPLAELEAAVRELRQRIENLGPVNMMALEEFQEAEQRHHFLETQRQDLLDAIADTQKAIQEMDSISRQKFQEAFERINGYFQESFRVLFGGGQGFLRLSESEGEGDAGVDIVAQPPGKKLQNALLLSGGEKAMTAMALLLAIFRYQPSPFCLLDEVDAPMDEANVARFSDMIQQMGSHTQFIVITHNKRTMEAAPTLYGVTMPQPGISRLVSVLVEEAQPEAARAAG